MPTHHRHIIVDDVDIFYREAGDEDRPHLLLLHGFPTSSHMYRNLIPLLATEYRVIAPDIPGFGFTESPARGSFEYSYDNLTNVMERFVEQLDIHRFALVVFDSGAPIGFRLAMRRPERIAAIICQNGNAYEEGLGKSWGPLQAYWANPTDQVRESLRGLLKLGTTKWRYTHGTRDASLIAPEAYVLDQTFLDWADNDEIQLDLFLDYCSNIALYPEFQRYFRETRPKMQIIWSNNDPFCLPEGALAFRRDNQKVEIHFIDGGHFPLETKCKEMALLMTDFLDKVFGDRTLP